MAFVLVAGLAGAPISVEAVSLVVLSGGVLVGDDLYRYGIDLVRYVQFWAVIAKIALLLIALALPAWGGQAVLFALVIGSVISHAPGRVRQAALIGEPGPCATRACKKPRSELTRSQ